MSDYEPPVNTVRIPTLDELRDRVAALERRLDTLTPSAPCGKLSRLLPMTVSARMAAIARYPKAAKKIDAQKWRRVCIAPLGHDGQWHRAEDGQVWHDSECRTVEDIREEDELYRWKVEALDKIADNEQGAGQ